MFNRRTLQDFVGGAIGGILGIYAFAYIYPNLIATGIGCLVGSAVGWFHHPIYDHLVKLPSMSDVRARLRAASTPEQKLARLRTIAIVIFVVVDALIASAAAFTLADSGVVAASRLAVIEIWCLGMCLYATAQFNDDWTSGAFESSNRRHELSQLERGGLIFIARKLLEIVWIGTIFATLLLGGLLYVVVTFVFIGIAMWVPLTVGRTLTKYLYLAAKHFGYWPCLATTITVTFSVVAIYAPSSEDPARALALLFLTGCLSGACCATVGHWFVIFIESDSERIALIERGVVDGITEDVAEQIEPILAFGGKFLKRRRRHVRYLLPARPVVDLPLM